MNEVIRMQLVELMLLEVLPAVDKFNLSTRSVLWHKGDDMISQFRNLRILEDAPMQDLWSFADRVATLPPSQLAEKAVSVLGVTKDMFWVVILHYALWQGYRDYKAAHGGKEPEDFWLYMHTMLTCDNPGEAIRKDM